MWKASEIELKGCRSLFGSCSPTEHNTHAHATNSEVHLGTHVGTSLSCASVISANHVSRNYCNKYSRQTTDIRAMKCKTGSWDFMTRGRNAKPERTSRAHTQRQKASNFLPTLARGMRTIVHCTHEITDASNNEQDHQGAANPEMRATWCDFWCFPLFGEKLVNSRFGKATNFASSPEYILRRGESHMTQGTELQTRSSYKKCKQFPTNHDSTGGQRLTTSRINHCTSLAQLRIAEQNERHHHPKTSPTGNNRHTKQERNTAQLTH